LWRARKAEIQRRIATVEEIRGGKEDDEGERAAGPTLVVGEGSEEKPIELCD